MKFPKQKVFLMALLFSTILAICVIALSTQAQEQAAEEKEIIYTTADLKEDYEIMYQRPISEMRLRSRDRLGSNSCGRRELIFELPDRGGRTLRRCPKKS